MRLLNYVYITDALVTLKKPLAKFVAKSLQNSRMYAGSCEAWWTKGVVEKLSAEERREFSMAADDDQRVESMDISLSVRLLEIYFNTVFAGIFGADAHMVRAWAQEIRSIRNSVGHQKKDDLSYEEARHGMEAMIMLLEKIYAVSEIGADEIERIREVLGELETKKMQVQTDDTEDPPPYTYGMAYELYQKAKKSKDYLIAAELFSLESEYDDARELQQECIMKAGEMSVKEGFRWGCLTGALILLADMIQVFIQYAGEATYHMLYAPILLLAVPFNALFGQPEMFWWDGARLSLVGAMTKIFSSWFNCAFRPGWPALLIVLICGFAGMLIKNRGFLRKI